MINLKNLRETIIEYTKKKYGKRIQDFHDKFYKKCPYKYDELDEYSYLKNFTEWLMFEKPLPDSGKTILEEFVHENPQLSNEEKKNLLGIKNTVSSEFIVISKDKLFIKLKDRKTGKHYNVDLLAQNPQIQRNTLIKGRIHPFGEHYFLAGVFALYNSPLILDTEVVMSAYDQSRIKDAENIIVSNNTKLSAILNKYPFQWVDGICEVLGINTKGKRKDKVRIIADKIFTDLSSIMANLPEKSKSAIGLVLNKGGVVKYGELSSYDDEIGFWWNDAPPNSSIGILRLYGLLAVGKMPFNGRMHRVAIVPTDIRQELTNEWKGNLK